MENYYQHPAPDAFVQAVCSLNCDGYSQEPARQDAALGFFSTVFQQNPKQVDYWLRSARFLPLPTRRTLAIAANPDRPTPGELAAIRQYLVSFRETLALAGAPRLTSNR